MQPSPARITEIDVNRPATALRVLRWSDFILVVGCGFGAAGVTWELVLSAVRADWIATLTLMSLAGVLIFAAYTGWRHIGVIDPRVWRSYSWVFALLVGVSVLFGVAQAATWIGAGANPFADDVDGVFAFAAYLQFAFIAVPGFVCVMVLRRTRVWPMGVDLADLLEQVRRRGGEPAAHLARVPRIDERRGMAYGIAGAAIALGPQLVPVSLDGQQAGNILRVLEQVTLGGFFLLIHARRYFQVSAEALLAVDRRAPVLFLRSFADDEQQRYTSSRRALLDFSLETRLANHFHRFGPFIAVGSPKETVPQPGAARALLPGDQWQSRVLEWMKAANVIIMYCGTTQWVNWELRQVIESGSAGRLIMMFPEAKGWRPSRRARDIAARARQIREAFHDTPWAEELREFDDFGDLRAMLFRSDGSMLMIRSRSRSRDAYHLAALIAHQQMLDAGVHADGVARETLIDPGRSAHSAASAGRRDRRIAAAVGALTIVLGGLYALGSSDDRRLTFERGELYYGASVQPEEAQRVGEYLVREQVFNDRSAATVQLQKHQGRYLVRLVVDPAVADSTMANIEFGLWGSAISRDALRGGPVDVELVDENLQPLRTVPLSERLAFEKGEIYYTHPVTVDEARGVGRTLLDTSFFNDQRAASVHLSREEGGYQLRFVVDASLAADSGVLTTFAELTRFVADTLGSAVVVHLCDQDFRTLSRKRVEPTAGAGRTRR